MTTTYEYPAAEGCHLFAGDPDALPAEPCAVCGEPWWADGHRTTEVHRELLPAELPAAVYAVEASDDGARTWAGNGLRFLRPEDAARWASGLWGRWFGCTNMRTVRLSAPDGEVVETLRDWA
jgi:hypothetical protein